MNEELVALLGELMANLDVPASMGALGPAREQWSKLRDRWNLFGWATPSEIAEAIRKVENE
jgi:hypothetical protein